MTHAEGSRELRLWSVIAVIYAVGIFIGSSIPAPELPQIITTVSDKLLHLAEYAGLGFLLQRAARTQSRWPLLAKHAFMAAALIAMAYGASDEVHQLFVAGRSAEVPDWIADTCGGLAGASIAQWIFPRMFPRFE